MMKSHSRRWVMGLDPGKGGGAAAIGPDGEVETLSFTTSTERDISDWVEELAPSVVLALLERVHSSPQMGVKSAFSFGRAYGLLRGLLTAHKVPWDEVSPAKWQREMRCLTGGDKRVTRAAAQRLFPQVKITHAIADALMIAEYARRGK